MSGVQDKSLIQDQENFRSSEDFREYWLEYQEGHQLLKKGSTTSCCCYCGKDFSTSLKHYNHERFCKDGNVERFPCMVCGLNFKTQEWLENHKKRHREPGGFPCLTCGAQFTSAIARRKHKNAQHRIFRCQICNIDCLNSLNYINHVLNTHSDLQSGKPEKVVPLQEDEDQETQEDKTTESKSTSSRDLQCKRCQASYNNVRNLIQHVKKVHKMQEDDEDWPKEAEALLKYSCEFCNTRFIAANILQEHLRLLHGPNGEKLFLCRNCRKGFESKEALKKHRIQCYAQCKQCKKKLSNKWSMKGHLKYCNEPKICKICNKSFANYNALCEHEKEHKEESYSCEYCEKTFKKMYLCRAHVKRHVKNFKKQQTFDCDLCVQQFHSKRYLIKHLMEIHGKSGLSGESEGFICGYCNTLLGCKSSLTRHMQTKHRSFYGRIQIKCRLCKENFDNLDKREEHEMSVHRDELTCHVCNKIYPKISNLRIHVKYKHMGENSYNQKNYLCGKCGKAFRLMVALRNHEMSNCGKSPQYQCDQCQKFFTTAGILKSHKVTHSGVRAFPCQFCDKKFFQKHQALTHERIHTGEKIFKCTYCSEAFVHYSTLQIHLSTHTGVKRYVCSGCGDRFTCQSNLRAHRKSNASTCGLTPLMGPIPGPSTKPPKQ